MTPDEKKAAIQAKADAKKAEVDRRESIKRGRTDAKEIARRFVARVNAGDYDEAEQHLREAAADVAKLRELAAMAESEQMNVAAQPIDSPAESAALSIYVAQRK